MDKYKIMIINLYTQFKNLTIKKKDVNHLDIEQYDKIKHENNQLDFQYHLTNTIYQMQQDTLERQKIQNLRTINRRRRILS